MAQLQWQAMHRAVLFIFVTIPVSAVQASWVWICFSSWHEQEQSFVFVCCFSVIGIVFYVDPVTGLCAL